MWGYNQGYLATIKYKLEILKLKIGMYETSQAEVDVDMCGVQHFVYGTLMGGMNNGTAILAISNGHWHGARFSKNLRENPKFSISFS